MNATGSKLMAVTWTVPVGYRRRFILCGDHGARMVIRMYGRRRMKLQTFGEFGDQDFSKVAHWMTESIGQIRLDGELADNSAQ